jgi:hypothetical protein
MTEELTEFHKHEVVHTSHIIVSMFNDFIAEHPYVSQNKELSIKADVILDMLVNFYQSSFGEEL